MNDRASYNARIAADHLRPLWEVLDELVPREPRPSAASSLWRYAQVRPALMEAGEIITAEEAVRRVLILENPGLPGSSRISGALYAGLQLILPGEVAPSHRHTQSALRFVVEGRGAYTAVDGERAWMAPGDFVITPAWTWHDHGNPGVEPVVWLDGLDIPMIALHDAGFAERDVRPVQDELRPAGDSIARFGAGLAPMDGPRAGPPGPMFHYPYAPSRIALAALMADGVDPAHGARMRYVDPTTGGWAMPTLGTWLTGLPAGFRGRAARSTDAIVCCCVEGEGGIRIGEREFAFGPHDVFVIPSWAPRAWRAEDECVLFCYSDRPVQQAMGCLRESVVGD